MVTPVALSRLAIGWLSFLALTFSGALLNPPVPAALLVAALVFTVCVIVLCSFGVVHEAERLARRLGDPYGTLVLTLSIVMIEVILISAVMLGPGTQPTIGRDSVMAVSMIILNLVIGLSLLIGGTRQGDLRHNRTGTSVYLVMLVLLSTLAFALPGLIGREGTYTTAQAVPIVILAVVLYAFFLYRQTGPQAADFREVASTDRFRDDPGPAAAAPTGDRSITRVFAEHWTEILLRVGMLVAMVLPVILLSQHMATFLEDGLGRAGAPVALAGVLIAMVVFLPESITSVRAAFHGEIQRVSNLNHGALVSTVALTIPSVLVIGMLTGQPVVLAETPVNLLLLGVTLLTTVATFSAKRVTAAHGGVHLALFAIYGLTVFA